MVKCMQEARRLERACTVGLEGQLRWPVREATAPAQREQWVCGANRGRGEKGLGNQVKDCRLHLRHSKE